MYSLHTKLISQQEDSRNLHNELWVQMRKCFSRVPETTAQFAAHPVNTRREDNDTPHKQPPCFWNEWEKPLHAELHSSSDLPNRNCESSRDPSASPRGRQVTAPPTQASPHFLHILSLSADNKVSSTFLSAFLLESCFSRCLAQPPVLNARPKTVREVCNNIYMHTYGQSAQSCLCLTTDGKTNNVSSSCPVYFETRLSFFGFRVIYSDW